MRHHNTTTIVLVATLAHGHGHRNRIAGPQARVAGIVVGTARRAHRRCDDHDHLAKRFPSTTKSLETDTRRGVQGPHPRRHQHLSLHRDGAGFPRLQRGDQGPGGHHRQRLHLRAVDARRNSRRPGSRKSWNNPDTTSIGEAQGAARGGQDRRGPRPTRGRSRGDARPHRGPRGDGRDRLRLRRQRTRPRHRAALSRGGRRVPALPRGGRPTRPAIVGDNEAQSRLSRALSGAQPR